MIENKNCFRCHKEIKNNENYFAMIEMNNKKIIRTNYVHKTCWDVFCSSFDNASNSLAKSNYLLNAMGNHMKKLGIIPEEKQEIIMQ